ncbi:MAG: hypothetical protein KUG69_12485 [Marinosulfonomonas sp.]|nr:hypothetical protein [Marinosulfonomonas sp.]
MKNISAFCLAVCLAVSPASAKDGDGDMREGIDLLQDGMQLLFRGLMDELGPAILELEGKIIDLSLYELPEVLPNGDIIIRRKAAPEKSPGKGEVDL